MSTKQGLSDEAWAQKSDGVICFARRHLQVANIAFSDCGFLWLEYNEMKKSHKSAIFIVIEFTFFSMDQLYNLYHISYVFVKNDF